MNQGFLPNPGLTLPKTAGKKSHGKAIRTFRLFAHFPQGRPHRLRCRGINPKLQDLQETAGCNKLHFCCPRAPRGADNARLLHGGSGCSCPLWDFEKDGCMYTSLRQINMYNVHTHIYIYIYETNKYVHIYIIWQCVKTLYPCSSHQNSWDLWMFIPLKMVLIDIDPYPYIDR